MMLPSLSAAELIKLKLDEVQNIVMEQERSVRTEMANLARERDSCRLELEKRTVEMEEEIQKLRREKANVEKELEMNRVKWELEKKTLEIEKEIQKMRREKADAERETNADQRKEELRRENQEPRAKMKMKMKESDKPRLSKDLPDFDENAGIGSSKKGSNCGIATVQGLTRGCKLERIGIIKDNLDKENLERFEQSCFGHLLKISDDNLRFQGQLISYLVMHMDEGACSKGRLVFTIKNSKIEFGLGEFSHITGLTDLGSSAAATTSSSIHNKVFQSRTNIDLKDIEEAFLKVSLVNGGKGELTLKLAFLYFLFGTLLGNYRRNVNLQYLHLVDDLHKFNMFPWGRAAYEVLFKSISALRDRMDGVAVTDKTLRGVNANGFTFALQIWAYEVMPIVAEYCACRAHNFDKGTPPILHWHATKTLYFKHLEDILTPGVLIKPLSMPKEMDLSKKGSRRWAHFVKTEVAAGDNQGCARASATCSNDEVKMRSGDNDHPIIICDSSEDEATDDDYCAGEDSNSIHDEQDSDDDSFSNSYMKKLVATFQSRQKKRQKKNV